MLFNSYLFIFAFLPIVLAGFFLLCRIEHRHASIWLFLTSLFFYGWWSPIFLCLLLASIFINYQFGKVISFNAGSHFGKLLLQVAIVSNLLLLFFFKYYNFFLSSINPSTYLNIPLTEITLPIGISFYTFTQIAFLVDSYRGQVRDYDPIHYGIFVTYFPHLIAGPILHHQQMMPQFSSPRTFKITAENFALGLTIFTIGLAKKILIADSFSAYASPVFSSAGSGIHQSAVTAWTGAFAYTMQLYFDFSGYCDMAIGVSLLFNINLPENFNSPYKASNIIDFWRSWHMTLSSFLKNYLYIPLGGSRHGDLRTFSNLLLTMLLGGLWHGANWTFVVWGGLHGIYLLINHAWRTLWASNEKSIDSSFLIRMTSTALTFFSVMIAWVFFRSTSLDSAIFLLIDMIVPLQKSILTLDLSLMISLFIQSIQEAKTSYALLNLGLRQLCFLILASSFIVWFLPNTYQYITGTHWLKWSCNFKTSLFWGVIFAFCLAKMNSVSEFLYFQF